MDKLQLRSKWLQTNKNERLKSLTKNIKKLRSSRHICSIDSLSWKFPQKCLSTETGRITKYRPHHAASFLWFFENYKISTPQYLMHVYYSPTVYSGYYESLWRSYYLVFRGSKICECFSWVFLGFKWLCMSKWLGFKCMSKWQKQKYRNTSQTTYLSRLILAIVNCLY